LAILGIDEVGRGPWAGPLVVGACLLPEKIEGLTDSKKLSAKKRESLAGEIREHADFGLGWIPAHELDKLGLTESLCKACREAVSQIEGSFDQIVIDGTINFLRGTKYEKIVQVVPKADFLVPEVSAASIIAKVSRDQYMYDLANKYPGYGFEKHVGYGTAAHKKAIEELGVCDEHRRSFRPIAQLLGQDSTKHQRQNDGQRAEAIVVEALRRKKHVILERNWRTKFCEVDIISEFEGVIYFTEVKYSKNRSGIERITDDKLKQMHFAAEAYLSIYDITSPAKLAAAEVSGKEFRITSFLILE
jgi:ribonuclease HII